MRDALALLVLAALGLSLPVLAHASPPDPSWIPGVYDDADYDDVVTQVVSGTGTVGPGILDALGFLPGRPEGLGLAPQAAPHSPGSAAGHGRAPPVA
jgi:hypothetical protein